MTILLSTPATSVDPVAAARRLAPAFRDRALEAERLRTMPADLVAEARAARLFHLALPRSLGGLELDLRTIFETIEEVAHADGSAGWTTMISNTSCFLAWLDPEVAAELVTDGVPTGASAFKPAGTATPTGAGTFRIDGQWGFNSSSPHADFVFNGVMVMDGERPRMRADGQPDWRFALVRHPGFEVLDTWDAMGLRGSGSHDVRIAGAVIPEEHTAMPFDCLARHDGPLWRIRFVGLLDALMAPIPLGIARRALDELAASASGLRLPNNPTSVADDPHIQVEMAKAESRLLAARAFFLDELGAVWDTACNGDVVGMPQLNRLHAASMEATASALEAVTFALRAAGPRAVYSTHPIQRCFRDVFTLNQHIAFGDNGWRMYAKGRFGVE